MPDSIPARILEAASTWGSRPALSWRDGRERRTLTYEELARRVTRLAAGFRTLGMGPGDRVVFLADNSPLWIQTDLALLHLGAIDVPRGSDTLPEELDYIVRHAEARFAVVETPALLERLGERRGGMEAVVLLEGEAEGVIPLAEIERRGEADEPPPPPSGPEDLATIVYTSGTTGVPKGVPLSHGNFLHQVRAVPEAVDIDFRDRFLTLLPAWHVYERAVEYIILGIGAELVYTSRRRLKEDLLREAPTFLTGVPRIFETIVDGAERSIRGASAFRRGLALRLLRRSLALGRARRDRLVEKLTAGDRSFLSRLASGLRYAVRALPSLPFHGLGHWLVYRQVHRSMGGRLRAAISGGGALPRHVEDWLDAVGLTVLVGYGLTETSPVLALSRFERNVIGTIGSPVAETEVQVRSPEGAVLEPGEEGVLWFRGPQVFRGYYRDPERSAEVLDGKGWFDTGDLGRLTPWGDIVFTGRAKETIVLRSGENIEPEPIELTILASPLVRQVLVLGQDRKHLGALIVPDHDALRERLGEEPTLAPDGPAAERLKEEIHGLLRARKGFRPGERIHAVRLIEEEFTVEAGMLTPTLKMRRDRILARHRAEVDNLFAEG